MKTSTRKEAAAAISREFKFYEKLLKQEFRSPEMRWELCFGYELVKEALVRFAASLNIDPEEIIGSNTAKVGATQNAGTVQPAEKTVKVENAVRRPP